MRYEASFSPSWVMIFGIEHVMPVEQVVRQPVHSCFKAEVTRSDCAPRMHSSSVPMGRVQYSAFRLVNSLPAISTGRSRPQGTPASLVLVRCAHSDESPASCVDGSFTPLRRLRRPHSATFVVQETWARMALVPQIWSKTSIRAPTQVCVPACATGMNRGERCKDVDARASTPVLLPFDTCSQRGEYLLSGYWAVHV